MVKASTKKSQKSLSNNLMLESTAKEPVYIIIPVYNRKETTLGCLDNLQKSGDLQRYHVVIVDDASTDGTAEAIHATYPTVTVVPGNGDLWWTGAIALGMEYAFEQKAKYFIWLNDDCYPDRGTLSALVEYMQLHPDTLVAPSCYANQSNGIELQHNGFQGRKSCAAKSNEVVFVDGMSGWCVGIPVAVFEKIGSPDANKFPHYSGDDIYTFRATRAGFKACLLGDFKVNLVGSVHARGSFRDYFRPGLTLADIFQALFWNKKSPYRLPTRFFYFMERYGAFFGTFLFLSKLTLWLTWSTWLYLSLRLKLQLRFN